MKFIPLTQGKVAIVDDEDFEKLNRYKWNAGLIGNIWYAKRMVTSNGRRKDMTMHRQLMKKPSGKFIDHINHDGLDNRRENLRICTRSQNNKNHRKLKNNTSGMNNVHWYKKSKKWMAYIKKDGKKTHLGLFIDKEEAGRAVDKKAKELFGEFAVLNFPATV
jgi:hypothetical protein